MQGELAPVFRMMEEAPGMDMNGDIDEMFQVGHDHLKTRLECAFANGKAKVDGWGILCWSHKCKASVIRKCGTIADVSKLPPEHKNRRRRRLMKETEDGRHAARRRIFGCGCGQGGSCHEGGNRGCSHGHNGGEGCGRNGGESCGCGRNGGESRAHCRDGGRGQGCSCDDGGSCGCGDNDGGSHSHSRNVVAPTGGGFGEAFNPPELTQNQIARDDEIQSGLQETMQEEHIRGQIERAELVMLCQALGKDLSSRQGTAVDAPDMTNVLSCLEFEAVEGATWTKCRVGCSP